MEPRAQSASAAAAMKPPAIARRAPESGAKLQRRLFSGMRWSFWLAAAAVPFSLGTRILLARAGPEILGTFGLLGVYTSLATVFLYLGGDAVVMAFLPRLAAPQQRQFLRSYSGIVALALVPWLVLATLHPEWLRGLFGQRTDPRLDLMLIWLAPLVIVYMLILAALNGLLEIAFAQGLNRALPIFSFFIYAWLCWQAPAWLRQHTLLGIGGVYLGLLLPSAALGLARLRRHLPAAPPGRHLPAGFWPYTLSLQSNSILNFFANRFDLLLVLRAGGLSALGEYVALKSLAQTLRKSFQMLLDSLFPSLAHTLGTNDGESTRQVLETYTRLLYPMAMLSATLVLCFAHPLLWLLGRPYLGLMRVLPWAVVCASMQAPNAIHGLLFNASGRAQRALAGTALQAAAFIGSFWPLWQHWGLAGAVAAWGLGEWAYYLTSYFLLRNLRSISLSALGNPGVYFTVIALTALWSAHAGRIEWQQGVLLWLAGGAVYFGWAGYRGAEFKRLGRLMWPGPHLRRGPGGASQPGLSTHGTGGDLGHHPDQEPAAGVMRNAV